ncbi:hypothetical protein IT411_01050 [Candidatus Peregrinibacteria bacterium]|nr:hypothetical protein [Candidatus Peregrinibacteria bacterium]
MSKKSLQLGQVKALEAIQERLATRTADQSAEQLLAEITAMVRASHQQLLSTLEEEPFDLSVYQAKLQKLLSYSEQIQIEALKDLPRDCELVVHKTYIKKKDGKFWKDAVIRVTNKTLGKVWYQTIKIQEFDQLDKHSAFKEIGQEMLPVRLNNEQLEVGIGIRNPVGALGQPVFYCQGGSTHRPSPSIFQSWPEDKLALQGPIRRDANRMSGQIKTGIALVESSDLPNINEDKERMVWFTIPELQQLRKEPQFCDASTNYLAEHLLGNLPQIKAALAKLG